MTQLTRMSATVVSATTDPAVGDPDHLNATIVPFRVRTTRARATPHRAHPRRAETRTADLDAPGGVVPIAQISPRQQAKVAGRVRAIQLQPRSGIPTLELTISDTADDTLIVVFLGRRRIPGIQPGAHLSVEAMVASRPGDSRYSTPSMRSSPAHQ